MEADVPAATATVVRPLERAGRKMLILQDGGEEGSLGDAGLDAEVKADALALLRNGTTEVRTYGPTSSILDPVDIFIESFAPLPRLLIMGAVHAAPALCAVAAKVGYRVTVIDARASYTTRERFPDAAEILVAWPHLALESLPPLDASTYVAVLTHDPKFEEPLLPVLLRSDARYVGMIGSRTTQRQRRAMLLQSGVSEEEIARLRGPIGLDIGAVTPEEIALAILSEMATVKYGRTGRPLVEISGAAVG
ncbi:MAG TPA: xanthine dehydrogenase [Chloroflexi bacterium]|nr:xanthine dehydrogenase [Chloroflexota bacterium]